MSNTKNVPRKNASGGMICIRRHGENLSRFSRPPYDKRGARGARAITDGTMARGLLLGGKGRVGKAEFLGIP